MWHVQGLEEVHRRFWWEPHKNISRGRPRCRWEYNIEMSLQEVGW